MESSVSIRKLSFLFVLVVFILIPLSSFALTISPPVYELSGKPGQVLKVGMKIFNEEKEFKTWYFSTQTFEAKGEEGEPVFVDEINQEGLAQWIKTPSKVSLAPGELKKIEFEINIPDNAGAGGHYAAIFLNSSPPQEKGVGVATRIGALVLLKVEGEVIEKGELLEFQIEDGRKIRDSLPVPFILRIENTGTVHIKPSGYIKIKNLFGKTTAELPVNLAKGPDGKWRPVGNILPNSIRKFSAKWGPAEKSLSSFWDKVKYQKNNFALGPYKAKLLLSYGANKDKLISSFLVFWILPWQLILVSLVILLAIILLVTLGIKRYNRWIIEKAFKSKDKNGDEG